MVLRRTSPSELETLSLDAARHPYQADIQLARKIAVLTFEAFLAQNAGTRKTFRSQLAKASTYPSEKVAIFCLLRSSQRTVMFYEFLQGESLENLVRRMGRVQRWEVLSYISRVVDGPQGKLEEAATNRKQLSSLIRSHTRAEGAYEVMDFGAVSMPEQTGIKMYGGLVITEDFVLPGLIQGDSQPDAQSPVFADALRVYHMAKRPEVNDDWITVLWRLPGYPALEEKHEPEAPKPWQPRVNGMPALPPPPPPLRQGPSGVRPKSAAFRDPEPSAGVAAAPPPARRKTRYQEQQRQRWNLPYLVAAALIVVVAIGMWFTYTHR